MRDVSGSIHDLSEYVRVYIYMCVHANTNYHRARTSSKGPKMKEAWSEKEADEERETSFYEAGSKRRSDKGAAM